MKKLALFAGAAALYVLTAWMVAPGFYDGFAPPQPYNWVCPPAQAGANAPPSSGHLVIKVIGGVSDANDAFTDDGQVFVLFLPGAFDATGKTSITVDITPVSPCPHPAGLHFVTNTYLITADAPLVKASTITMRYSNLVPDPSAVYMASSADGQWKSLGASNQAQLYTIDTSIDTLGYFAAGYPSSATNASGPRLGGGQLLPVVVAGAIVVVILAGIPLAIVRRRRAAGEPADDEDDS